MRKKQTQNVKANRRFCTFPTVNANTAFHQLKMAIFIKKSPLHGFGNSVCGHSWVGAYIGQIRGKCMQLL